MELTNGEFARHLLVAADMLDCADNSGNKIVPGIVRSMRKASGIITAYEETMGRLGLTPDDLPRAAELLKAEREGQCVMLDEKTALAMFAGARAIESNKRLYKVICEWCIPGERGEPKEISYYDAAKRLHEMSEPALTLAEAEAALAKENRPN